MFSIMIFDEVSEQGGIGWFVWVALVLFFIMVFLGWLVASKGWLKSERTDSVQKPDDHDTSEEKQSHLEETRTNVFSIEDDLTELEGIGPKVAKVLAEIGITTFDDLAKADYTTIKIALQAAGYKYMDPAGWIEQAVFAAKGDRDGLKILQDSLKGGRRVVK